MILLCGIWRLALLTLLRNGLYRVSSSDWCAVDCSEWWYRDLRVRTFWRTSFGRIRLRWERRGSEKRVHEAPCKEPVLRRKSQLLEQEVSVSKRILVRQFYRISEILILRPIRKAILGPVSLRKRHFAVSFFEQLEVQI